jgi:hypothetical protein
LALRFIAAASSGCFAVPEKKTADDEEMSLSSLEEGRLPFLSIGGASQARYERLRSYMLEDPAFRPRVSPAQFDLRRLNHFGLLGLADHGWQRREQDDFEVAIIPMESDDASDRLARLFELLTKAVAASHGGGDATSCAVREGIDRPAGEGADDPEPARCGYAFR